MTDNIYCEDGRRETKCSVNDKRTWHLLIEVSDTRLAWFPHSINKANQTQSQAFVTCVKLGNIVNFSWGCCYPMWNRSSAIELANFNTLLGAITSLLREGSSGVVQQCFLQEIVILMKNMYTKLYSASVFIT